MAGLAPSTMMPPVAPGADAAMVPQAAPEAPMPDDDEGVPASPEEQALYDQTVAAAMIALYDGEVMDGLVEALRDDGADPQTDIAEVASSLIIRVNQEAAKAGTAIPGDVLLHAGREVVEAAAEIAERIGLPMDEAATEQAFYQALDSYRVKAQALGLWDEEGSAQDAQAIRDMDGSGELGRLMGAGQGAPAAAPMPPQPGAL